MAQKAHHWISAAVVLSVTIMLSMIEGPVRDKAYELHKSSGLGLVGLIGVRLIVWVVLGHASAKRCAGAAACDEPTALT